MIHWVGFLLVCGVAGVMCGLIVGRLIHFERMGEVGQIIRVARASRFRVVRISPEMGALLVVTVLPLFGLQYGLSNKADKLDSHFSYELGKSAVVEGRLADALDAFQEAGRLNPRDERVYTSIGVVYFL